MPAPKMTGSRDRFGFMKQGRLDTLSFPSEELLDSIAATSSHDAVFPQFPKIPELCITSGCILIFCTIFHDLHRSKVA